MNTTIWHKVITQGIDQSVDNPDVVMLVSQWQQYEQTGKRASLAQFGPGNWLQLASQMMLLRREGASDYRVHHHGAQIAAQTQFDATGQYLSQLDGEMAGFFLDVCRDTSASNQARYTVHLTPHSEAVSTWEQLLLPLVDDHGHEWLLVYRKALEWRHQRVDAMINAIGAPMLCLRALSDERGVVLDWLILVANPALGSMFGIDPTTLIGRTASAALPHWGELDLGADCVAAMRFGTPRELNRLVGHDDGELRQIAVNVGPLTDGVVLSLSDLTRLLEPRKGTSRLVGTDSLTGLADRHEFDERLRAEVLCARRARDGLSLVMAEIDHFPAYVQARGRHAGDDVLRRVSRLAASACERENDFVARVGPQTFALLLPATDGEGAAEVVARLRRGLEHLCLSHPDSPTAATISLSLGLACFRREGDELDLFDRTEQALLEARLGGGHRFVIDPASVAGGQTTSASARVLAFGRGPLPGMEMYDVELPELAMRESGFLTNDSAALFSMAALTDIAHVGDGGRASAWGSVPVQTWRHR
jgi:diguanylate cyclase (GGDEF)-like protein